MSNEWKCPKCNIGAMRQQGLMSCNWRCEVCGNKIYVPRPQMQQADLSEARKTVSRMQSESASVKKLSRAAMDAAEAYNQAVDEKIQATKKLKILQRNAARIEVINKKYKNDPKKRYEEIQKSIEIKEKELRNCNKKSGSFIRYLIMLVIFILIVRHLGLI